MKAVGCHIYAGGFTLGVNKHFNVVAHFEDGNFGTQTVAHNMPKIDIYTDKSEWPFIPDIDLVFCNPPCAPWSQSAIGRDTTWFEDPRTSCVKDCYSLVDKLKPKVYAHESVRGLYNRGLSLIMELVEDAANAGYAPYFVLVDAKEHGIAQSRKRFFLVLSQVELIFRPTLRPGRTSGEVLRGKLSRDRDCKNLGNKSKWQTDKVLNEVDQGEQVIRAFNRLYPKTIGVPKAGRGSFLHRRLHPDKLAPVFAHMTLHPTYNRFLNIAEAAALTGFPPDYEFIGSVGTKYDHISKGVLPPVAEYLAGVIKRGIRRNKKPTTMDPRQVKVYSDRIEISNV